MEWNKAAIKTNMVPTKLLLQSIFTKTTIYEAMKGIGDNRKWKPLVSINHSLFYLLTAFMIQQLSNTFWTAVVCIGKNLHHEILVPRLASDKLASRGYKHHGTLASTRLGDGWSAIFIHEIQTITIQRIIMLNPDTKSSTLNQVSGEWALTFEADWRWQFKFSFTSSDKPGRASRDEWGEWQSATV